MKCENCPYCEKRNGEKFATCHFVEITGEDISWLNVPPCEEEEEERQEEKTWYEEEERALGCRWPIII